MIEAIIFAFIVVGSAVGTIMLIGIAAQYPLEALAVILLFLAVTYVIAYYEPKKKAKRTERDYISVANTNQLTRRQ